MRGLLGLTIVGVILVVLGVLFLWPSSRLTVTNRYGYPIERVIVRDAAGIACELKSIRPGTSASCGMHLRSEGAVTYELTAVRMSRSGTMGSARPGGSYHFTIALERDGRVVLGGSKVEVAEGGR